MKKKYLEQRPSDPATQRIILKIVGFMLCILVIHIVSLLKSNGNKIPMFGNNVTLCSKTQLTSSSTAMQYVKSDNLQYNTLGHWVAGTNDSSTKRLMFQALFFFIISYRLRALKTLYFNFFLNKLKGFLHRILQEIVKTQRPSVLY